jgi:hypothetical protein
MACVDELPYEVILSKASFAECRAYVEKRCPQYCHVEPGFTLFEKHIIGVPPIAIGVDGDVVFFPYTKPCYGTFLLRIEDATEAARLAPRLKKRK